MHSYWRSIMKIVAVVISLVVGLGINAALATFINGDGPNPMPIYEATDGSLLEDRAYKSELNDKKQGKNDSTVRVLEVEKKHFKRRK